MSYVYHPFLFHDYVAGPMKHSDFSMHRQVTFRNSTFCLQSALRVLYGSRNKQWLFLVRAKLACFYNLEPVFTARYEMNI